MRSFNIKSPYFPKYLVSKGPVTKSRVKRDASPMLVNMLKSEIMQELKSM
jgi:hypothetical protein